MKGLIVLPYWADEILSGRKTLEIRGRNTKIRGPVAIIKSGTSKVYGIVNISNSQQISEKQYISERPKHLIKNQWSELPYNNVYGWSVSSARMFKKPVNIEVKQGCIIWVDIPIEEAKIIEEGMKTA